MPKRGVARVLSLCYSRSRNKFSIFSIRKLQKWFKVTVYQTPKLHQMQ